MNHLAHFKLAKGDPHLVAGAILGDHVKGRLVGRMAPDLELGIHLHRRIDAYTDAHPVARRSGRRLPPEMRRYAPILIDVVYDHILATGWDDYHPEPLESFTRQCFAALESLAEELPPRTVAIARRMEESAILERYRDPDTIAGVLHSISARLSRPNPVADAVAPLLENLGGLRDDFTEFFPQMERFVTDTLQLSNYRAAAYAGSGGTR